MSLIVTKSVAGKIADELVSRLEALVTEPGDSVAFSQVVRPTKSAQQIPEHLTIVVTRGEAVRVPELDCAGNPPSIAWQQTFSIRVHIAPSEKDITSIDEYEEYAEAEIYKAVASDSMWHTFDSNAINAEFLPTVTATGDGGYEGIAIPVAVTYRVSEYDPYTVRA